MRFANAGFRVTTGLEVALGADLATDFDLAGAGSSSEESTIAFFGIISPCPDLRRMITRPTDPQCFDAVLFGADEGGPALEDDCVLATSSGSSSLSLIVIGFLPEPFLVATCFVTLVFCEFYTLMSDSNEISSCAKSILLE